MTPEDDLLLSADLYVKHPQIGLAAMECRQLDGAVSCALSDKETGKLLKEVTDHRGLGYAMMALRVLVEEPSDPPAS